MARARGLFLVPLVSAWLAGCPSDDQGCKTTADCSEQGLTQSRCVNGACIRTCERDGDCKPSLICEDGDAECEAEREQLEKTTFICESLQCVAGCPDTPCPSGEMCVAGRCAHYFESFEPEKTGDRVTLEGLGWNAIERPLRNIESVIVWRGVAGCGPADPRDRCAGPAAHGEYYLAIERVPTPERANREFGVTCTACKCCLECKDPASRTSTTSVCPNVTYPEIAACAAGAPAQCQQICAACDACTADPDQVADCDPNDPARPCLNMCEQQAGGRTCPGCAPYDQCVQDKYAEMRACPGGNYPRCMRAPETQTECQACLVLECEDRRAPCWACRDSERLRTEFPNEPERWRDLARTCAQQGNDGCYPTPIRVRRSELFPDEQALESPPIDLTKAAAPVVLELAYVPFDVGETYTRVLQERARSEWPTEPQEVAIQLCPAGCEQSSAWVDAKLASGRGATIPSTNQKKNGLAFAQQNQSDWLVNTIEVEIPDSMRTATFRFRLLPRLADDVRVGVDRVTIRRRK